METYQAKKRKLKREQVKRYRDKKRSQGFRMKTTWVPFRGLEKIGTDKVKRKASMVPEKKWTHASRKRGNKIRGAV